MKRLLPLLFAGAILTSLAYGTDHAADERFRIKYGRYSPAAEARHQAAARAAHEETPPCCRTASLSRTAVEERLRAKLGRTTSREEVREQKAGEESAAREEKCVGLGACTRMDEKAVRTDVTNPPMSTEVKERANEKYGRSFEIAAAPGTGTCEHDCCNREAK